MFDFIYNLIKLTICSFGVVSGGTLLWLYSTIPNDNTFEPVLIEYAKAANKPSPAAGLMGKIMTSAAAAAIPSFSNIVIKDYKFVKIASVTLLDQTIYFVGIAQSWIPAGTLEQLLNGYKLTAVNNNVNNNINDNNVRNRSTSSR